MQVLDQLNSRPLYLISGGIILFVVVMSLFFLIRAYRAGIAIGRGHIAHLIAAGAVVSVVATG